MKKFIALLSLSASMLSLTANANVCEEMDVQAAQIVAKVASIEQIDVNNCQVKFANLIDYKGHYGCELSSQKILAQGILMQGADCSAEVGSTVSGVVLDQGEFIFPEDYLYL